MGRHLPPFKQLEAFEAAAHHGSFSRAADDLCVTTSSLSRRIKTLEDNLGVPLFNRTMTGVELTTAGRHLLPTVRSAISRLELTTKDLSQYEQQTVLVVGCQPTLALYWMIPLLTGFRANHPNIQVNIQTYTHPSANLHRGIDVAIDSGVAEEINAYLSHRILDERYGPVCHPDLWTPGKRQDLDSLADLTLLHTESRTESWDQWCHTFGFDDFQTAKGPYFTHAYLMLQAASIGHGVGIAVQAWVPELLKRKRLIAPYGFVPSGNQIRIYYLAEHARLPRIRAFCDWLLTHSSLDDGEQQPSENQNVLPLKSIVTQS